MEGVKEFLSISSGYGSGSDYGDGSGYGSDSGYGSGYGPVYGSGSGYGDGPVYGSGSGYGDGYGYGIKNFNGKSVYRVDGVQTIIDSIHGNIASGFILKSDLTLTKTYVAKVGNSFAHGRTAHKALADAMAKDLEKRPLSERIDLLKKEIPDADREVSFESLYSWHHVLTGSCKQGRDNFCEQHGIDRSKKYTLRYFFSLTQNAYGSEAIRAAAEAYGIDIEDKSDEE